MTDGMIASSKSLLLLSLLMMMVMIGSCVSVPSTPAGKYEGRPFVNYPIFKGKAALSMSPVPPKFNKMNVSLYLSVFHF